LTSVVVHIDRATTRTAALVPTFAYVHDSAAVRYVPGSGFLLFADDLAARLIGRFAR
jgi:hypothetical protein